MPTFRLTRPAVIFTALFVMLIMALPALAGPPEHSGPYQWTDDYGIDCEYYGYDFDLHIVTEYNGRATFFLDEDSDVTRAHYHFWGSDTVTNTKNGLVATGPFSIMATEDWDDFTETVTGVDWMLRAPGRGIVFHSAGRLIIDYEYYDMEVIFKAGRHDFEGGYPALCEAMS